MKKINLVVCVLFVVCFSSCKKTYTCACKEIDSSEPRTNYIQLKSYSKARSKNYCENHSDIHATCELQ